MKRISLRVADHQHAALCRVLTLERAERGNRYSLNDLCVRYITTQLSRSDAGTLLAGAPSPLGDGTMHILRTPPPPPVPRVQPAPSMLDTWTLRDVQEPQPERATRPSELREEGGHDGDKGGATVSPIAPDENEQAELDALAGTADAEAAAEAQGQWESEGGHE